MTQNLHFCAIFFRPEVVYDVISGRNVKTTEGYPVVNFEVASSNSFLDITKKHFVTAVAAADIDYNIKRKRFRVSLKNAFYRHILNNPIQLFWLFESICSDIGVVQTIYCIGRLSHH